MDETAILTAYHELGIKGLKGMVIGLTGKLGAGKTYFVKELLNRFSPELGDQVSSPTFSLCNVYQIGRLEVHHYDVYRIESEADLYNTGIWESIENTNALIIIEWVDMFPLLADRCDEIVTISAKSAEREYHRQICGM